MNLRSRAFVLFIILSYISTLIHVFLFGGFGFLADWKHYVMLVLIIVASVLLIKNKFYGWIGGILLYLLFLIDNVPYLFMSGFSVSMFLNLFYTVFYLLMIAYCIFNLVTDIKKVENTKLDLILGIAFVIITAAWMTELIFSLAMWRFFIPALVKNFFMMFVYVFSVIIWQVLAVKLGRKKTVKKRKR